MSVIKKTAGIALDLGSSWTNVTNSIAEDGAYAQALGSAYVAGVSSKLDQGFFGIVLPSTAVIDGIIVGVKYAGTNLTALNVKISAAVSGRNATKVLTGNPTTLTWAYAGSATDNWGGALLAADFTASNDFLVDISAAGPSGAIVQVDAVYVEVYYHIGAASNTPTDVPTREVYKVRTSRGQYIGTLPTPTEPLKLNQDINSLGVQVTIDVPVSPDNAAQAVENYTIEDASADYTAEDGVTPYTTEGAAPLIATFDNWQNVLIKNGNIVEHWIYNYWYPNGKCMLTAKIRRWEAGFGGSGGNDTVKVTAYSTSYDLDNYITRGAPFVYTTDQSQLTQDSSVTVQNFSPSPINKYVQQFVVGAGVTNIAAVKLMMNGSANLVISLVTDFFSDPLAVTLQSVNTVGAQEITFAFGSPVTVVAGQTYGIKVEVYPNNAISLYYKSGDPYAGGGMYSFDATVPQYLPVSGDLYFATLAAALNTKPTFTSKDPSTGMLAPIITDYITRGGLIAWTASSIDATGLSLTYTFNVATINEALQAILSLAPNGFYYYIDVGAQIIYFKNQSTTPDFILKKGVHVNQLNFITSTEQTINYMPFTGGEVSPGVNLYKLYTSETSIAALGPLLNRRSDSRVILDATANAIGTSEIAERSGEQYNTTVIIPHTTDLDITLLTPGKTVGIRGYGNFIDRLTLQIVRREWQAEQVALTLGVLPLRQISGYDAILRQLVAMQTQDNPSTPT